MFRFDNCFPDDFATKNTQRIDVVLDNASIHCYNDFQAQIPIWEEQDSLVFHLPKYSPHPNLIERLWLKCKYEWLKPHHCLSFDTLTDGVEDILSHVGEKFKVNYQERKHFTEFETSSILV